MPAYKLSHSFLQQERPDKTVDLVFVVFLL